MQSTSNNNYDTLERKPYLLYPCCHTYCQKCICDLNCCPNCLLSIQDKKENTGVLDCLNKAATKFNNKQLDRIESSSQLNQLEIETKEKEIKSKSIQLENKIATYTNKIIDLLMQQQNELILALREQETKGLNQLEQCLKHKKQIDIKINETKSNITRSGSSNIDSCVKFQIVISIISIIQFFITIFCVNRVLYSSCEGI